MKTPTIYFGIYYIHKLYNNQKRSMMLKLYEKIDKAIANRKELLVIRNYFMFLQICDVQICVVFQ